MNEEYKIGHSYDIHRLKRGLNLIIGGIIIPYKKGIVAHSDGDVLIHSITEAILGSLGLGDLGTHFPDTDIKNLNLDSFVMLEYALDRLKEYNYKIVNIDSIVYLEKPKMKDYVIDIKNNINRLLNLDNNLNIKFTTFEKLGSIGRNKDIASETIILIKKV